MFQFEATARSHRGRVRTGNEDSGFAGGSLLVVADGVGGSAAGEVASSTAVGTAVSLSARWADGEPTGVLGAVVEHGTARIRADVAAHPGHVGTSSTLTAVQTDGSRFALVHLGDSRAYLLRGRRLFRMTRDHTLVAELVAAGRLSAEEAHDSPYRHHVTRWLGADGPAPDLGRLELVPGDRVLLCSDGLHDLVDDDLVARLLAVGDRDVAAALLVDAALEAGGSDNVTVVVGDVVDRPDRLTGGTIVGAALDLATVATVAV